jgi:urease accessory protein
VDLAGNAGDLGSNGWHAALSLGFAASDGATWLAHRAHRGPLAVQRPFLPEGPGVCHVYLLHPPGGLVGGDEIDVEIRIDTGAHALLTTPAAGKVYRTNGSPVRQTQRMHVADGGTLEWLPQETILYDGARARLGTRIELARRARFIGVDMVCFGLPARRAPFLHGDCRQTLEILRDGRPLLVERGHFDARSSVWAARWGLGGAGVLAVVVAVPAPSADVVDAVRSGAADAPDGDLGAVTVVGDGDLMIARYLGGAAERARAFVHDTWRIVRPALLRRPAVPPRVWAT